MATIGVIGGMGPLATAVFYAMLTNGQAIEKEQDYSDIIIYSKPSIADRTAFILGKSETNPLDGLIHAALTLQNAGANFIAMTCVTSHFFLEDLTAETDIPIINLPMEIAKTAAEEGLTKVGLLATDGTLESGILNSAFNNYEIETIIPTPQDQASLMEQIYNLKQGNYVNPDTFDELEENLYERGAESVVLGCTELSLLTGPVVKDRIDALKVLAQASLNKARGNK